MTNDGDKVSLKIKSEQQNYEQQQWNEVSPLFQMTNDGDKVSLKIKSEQQNYEQQQWNEQCATPKKKRRQKKGKGRWVKT